VGIVVGLALSAVVQSLATGQQPFGDGAFVAAAPFSVALIWALTAGLNGSSLGPTLSNNPDYLLSMNFSASTLTLLLASGSFVIALIGLIDSSADAAAYLGLTFAVVGLFTALAARVSGNFFWGSVSVVTDVTSIGIDVTGLQSKNGRQGSALVLNVLGLVFDSLSAIIDFKTSLTNLPPE